MEDNDLSFYRSFEVPSVDLISPGIFLPVPGRPKKWTVFLRCDSDALAFWEYKPDFPDSFFHVTLYDGANEMYARSLLDVLRSGRWGFSVPLPPGTHLTEVQIGAKRPRGARPETPGAVTELYQRLFGEPYSASYLKEAPEQLRLEQSRVVLDHLWSVTGDFAPTAFRTDYDPPVDPAPSWRQELYPPAQLQLGLEGSDITPAAARHAPPTKDIHLTPPELALGIASYAMSLLPEHEVIDFGDPAIGRGVFFLAADLASGGRLNSAVGVEINEARGLATAMRWGHRGLEVIASDFMHLGDLSSRSLILANPPYLRFQALSRLANESWREKIFVSLGLTVSGYSGFYVYFLLLSHSWMRSGGVAAWLIPSEFMETNYGSSVREYLTQRVQLIRVHRFDRKKAQFEDVLVSSAVVVFRKAAPKNEDVVEFSSGSTIASPDSLESVPLELLRMSNRWSLPWNTQRPSDSDVRLGSIFEIVRGIATGANEYFILERSKAKALHLPDEVLKPVLPKSRYLPGDTVESDPLGYALTSPQLCLIDCRVPEQDLQVRFPAVYDYFQSFFAHVSGRTLLGLRSPWYKQERRAAPPYVCTYMGRGSSSAPAIRFLRNRSNAIATNTYLMLYLRPEIAAAIEEDEERYSSLLTVLQSIPIESILSEGRNYGGGLHKIEPRELACVKLPNLPAWLRDAQRLPSAGLGPQSPPGRS